MKVKLYYQLSFYLSGEHYIYHPDGKKGEVHPHSWEIVIKFTKKEKSEDYDYFTYMEDLIKNYLAIYENQLLNQIPPFDNINATLENIARVFYTHIRNILDRHGFMLLNLVISESPSRRIEIDAIDDMQKMQEIVADQLEEHIIDLAFFKKKKEQAAEPPPAPVQQKPAAPAEPEVPASGGWRKKLTSFFT